jgi:hypothetical protein
MAPNVRSVPIDEGNRSGTAMSHQMTKGWKQPEELGIAPICEFQGCWEPLKDSKGKWLTTVKRTPWGNYCSDTEARIIGFSLSGEAAEVQDQKKRRQQLRSVDLG